MTFPNEIERTIELSHPPAKVWTALTTAEGLGSWFGSSAEIDLRPGGVARMAFASENLEVTMIVKVVEEPSRFAYTWSIMGLADDDPRRTFVDFLLEPTASGTRLTVLESGFAQVPDDVFEKAYGGNTEGWASELGELMEYLDAA
jgi:uncharacterized protein YndB with AHSA1/START domain